MSGLAASTLLGGVGLFLLGMNLMTESLTALGGKALRSVLRALVRNRFNGLAFGAGVTTTLQSSSATTLITVGFVSAGLISFHQSLPVIFGANLGTTSTAWIVSLIGLEMKVSAVALPLVGVGALIRLLSRGRRARVGFAIAGFGLIFVGIDVMQEGMSGLELDLQGVGRGFLGVLAMVGLGAVMTVVMQSSSAAVATTLVALDAGSIDSQQAAALVIGQNVGTTVTAIIGALGSTVSAKRAAAGHTLFNLGTGAVALVLLGPFLAAVDLVAERMADPSPETGIAIFHTAFNVLGVALFLPFSARFAALVERLVPERGVEAVRRLAPSALQVPAVALEATRHSIAEVAMETLRAAVQELRTASSPRSDRDPLQRARAVLAEPWRLLEQSKALLPGAASSPPTAARRLSDASRAIDTMGQYLGKIRTSHEPLSIREEHVELLHAIDHIRRLVRAYENREMLETIESDPLLRRQAAAVADDLEPLVSGQDIAVDPELFDRLARVLERATRSESERREAYRHVLLARIADGDVEPIEAEKKLGACRWIAKTPKHAERVFHHLAWTSGAPHLEPDED